MILLFMLGVILLLIGVVFTIGGIVEGDGGMGGGGVVSLILGIALVFTIYSTQAERAVANGDIQERFGVVTRISNDSVKLDNQKTFSTNEYTTEKFKTDLAGLKIGDLVKVTYLEGTLDTFVLTVEPVTLVEGEEKK